MHLAVRCILSRVQGIVTKPFNLRCKFYTLQQPVASIVYSNDYELWCPGNYFVSVGFRFYEVIELCWHALTYYLLALVTCISSQKPVFDNLACL